MHPFSAKALQCPHEDPSLTNAPPQSRSSLPPKGISSRAIRKAFPRVFLAPTSKNRPSRAPRSPIFADLGRKQRRRTQAEPGALGGAGGRRTNFFGAKTPRARRVSDTALFSPLR